MTALWLTRDSRDGVLSEDVDVWRSRPLRFASAELIVWLPGQADKGASIGDAMRAEHECSIEISAAAKRFGTLPETSRECVRIEAP